MAISVTQAGHFGGSPAARIAPRIFQTWRDAPQVPGVCVPWVEQVRDLCAQWNFTWELHDDSQILALIDTDFPQLSERFRQWEPIIQVDLWRYLVIYRHGGFYLDVDCEPMAGFKRLPTLLDRPVVQIERDAPHKAARGVLGKLQVGQFFFGFPAGHPLLGAVIDEALLRLEQRPYQHLPRNEQILHSTGPHVFGHVMIQNLDQAHAFRRDEGVDHRPMGTWRTPGTWPTRRPIQKRIYYSVKHFLLPATRPVRDLSNKPLTKKPDSLKNPVQDSG